MSSMRNAVQRRNHKERAQPLEREKWGLLEKRKDYKLRAKDHKAKQARLKLLRQKATEKNPDEFSFAMMSSRVDAAGRKIADRGNTALSTDVVKLLKTQDAAYIRTMLQMVRKEREELEQRMVLDENEVRALRDGEEGKSGMHTVFVGEKEQQRKFKEAKWFGTKKSDADRVWNRPRKVEAPAAEDEDDREEVLPKKMSKKQQEAAILAEKEARAMEKKRERLRERLVVHLEAVKARERDLMAVEEELEKQRAKMNASVGGVNKHGVKFKIRERKR